MNKEGIGMADREKRPSEERDPGKYYEKLSMSEVKHGCGREVGAMALDRGGHG